MFPGTDSQAYAQDVALAPTGEVVIAGSFTGSLQMGSTHLTSLGGTSANGFVAILDPMTLAAQRAFGFGGSTLYDLANSVEVTRTGALRVSGALSGMSTIGGMTVQADENGSAFIAELTATGTANWVSLVEGSGGIVFGADTNSAGRTFAAGRLNGVTNDAYLAAVGPDPALTLPLRATAGANANGAVSAAADHHGGVWVGGEFEGTIDLGSPPLSGPDPMQPTNFLVHLEP